MPHEFVITRAHVISCAPTRKSTNFRAPIFKKRINARQNDVHISCNEFHPNRPRNVISTGINSFTPLHIAWLSMSRFSRNSCLLDNALISMTYFMKIWQTVRYVRDVRTWSHTRFLFFSLFLSFFHKGDLNWLDGFKRNLKTSSFRTNALLQLSMQHISTYENCCMLCVLWQHFLECL